MVQVSFIVLFVAAIISAKTVIPTANNATFAAITNAPTKLFTQNIRTMVASQMSKNRSCNGRWMVQGLDLGNSKIVIPAKAGIQKESLSSGSPLARG